MVTRTWVQPPHWSQRFYLFSPSQLCCGPSVS